MRLSEDHIEGFAQRRALALVGNRPPDFLGLGNVLISISRTFDPCLDPDPTVLRGLRCDLQQIAAATGTLVCTDPARGRIALNHVLRDLQFSMEGRIGRSQIRGYGEFRSRATEVSCSEQREALAGVQSSILR